MGSPPFAGAVQDTVSWFTDVVATGAPGVAGTVVVVTDTDDEALESPESLDAITEIV
jgi:hypothetical protein